MKYFFSILSLFISSLIFGQSQTKRVLFLGNSYTDVNNLPQLLSDVATSMGDILIFDSNNPGGYTLQGHSTNAASLGKIMLGNWDNVVLQEQSQLPSFPISQVEAEVFPFAHILDSIIKAYNPCSETVFYMTWGRMNGDASNCASWPPVCTYEGMDSLLNLRYRMMADSNHAILSPVGAVWHYVRQNFPSINLYQADESHPSIEGSYLAACTFYTTLYKKDPVLIHYSSTLSAVDAANIRTAVKLMVYDSLMKWHIGEYVPMANFNYQLIASNQIGFLNTSANSNTYSWDFGDGSTSAIENPQHQYAVSGNYTVRLIANKCNFSDTTNQVVNVTATIGINRINNDLTWTLYPNPVTSTLTLKINDLGKLTYRIFNFAGIEVKNGSISNYTEKIDIASLSEGVYFIQLLFKNESIGRQKFVKR
jgi:hypothetical protein